MKHNERLGFRDFKVINTHFHHLCPVTLEESVEIFQYMRDYYEYDALGLMSVIDCDHRYNDITANLKGIYIKARLNEDRPDSCYVYAAPQHYYDGRDTAEGYLIQAKAIYEMGFDGFKSLDGKPERRKVLARPLCDPIFDEMYGYLESVGLPVKMHVTDPRMYWGKKENLPPVAIARGWWCGDGTFTSFEDTHAEVRGILDKFPRLRFCMAHMGYLTDAPVDWESWLKDYENTSYDLTPGASTFVSFTKDPDLWRALMEKYSNRIFFGTDTYNQFEEAPEEVARGDLYKTSGRHNMVRRGLEGDPASEFDLGSLGIARPLGLSDSALENIYSRNFRAQQGEPRKINSEAVLREVSRVRRELTTGVFNIPEDEVTLELGNLKTIEDYFAEKR